MSNSKVKMQKISANPNVQNEVDLLLNNYQLQAETKASILEFANKCKSGEINSNEITVFIPLLQPKSVMSSDASLNAGVTNSSRTYVGYGNKTYYEEIIAYSSTSNSTTVKDGKGWVNYLNTTIEAAAKAAFDSGMTVITGGAWTIISVFGAGAPTGVTPNTSFRFESRLHEYKLKKFTYVVDSGQKYFGSRVESASSYFDNTVVYPGLQPVIQGKNTQMSQIVTSNYNQPDKKAYSFYVNGGYVEPIYSYTYGGVVFNSL